MCIRDSRCISHRLSRRCRPSAPERFGSIPKCKSTKRPPTRGKNCLVQNQHLKRQQREKANARKRTELTMFLCSTNSICRAFESINRSVAVVDPSKAKVVAALLDASKAENGRQILCPWLSTSRTMMMMGRYCEEGDDGGAMPFMCSRWRKRRRQIYGGNSKAHLDVLFRV